jgi:signal transduction histidine kinase
MDRHPVTCWEHFRCDKTECAAYRSNDLRCWLVSQTHCHEGIQGTWLEKMEVCIDCEVFARNSDAADWPETLRLIAKQFTNYRERIEENQRQVKESKRRLEEFKRTSIYLLSELDKKGSEVKREKELLEQRYREKTAELSALHDQLVQSGKMAAMGRFSAGIAHEINNPLGAIINYARTLIANPEIKGQNRGYLELVVKGLFRIENIVRQILNYSGAQKPNLQRTDINRLVDESLVYVRHRIDEKAITLELRHADSLPFVHVDPAQMHQVVVNLVNNAVDAMENGGRLVIETEARQRQVEIRFMDTGTGIPEKEMHKLYEPFYTTKDVGRGTGLGLFICYNILQMVNGSIHVQSQPGAGTCVTVRLPVPDGSA